MLRIDSLSVSYGPIQALRDVSLEVKQGEIVALIGSNGAGKSTTLRAISGLLRPQTGRIQFDGRDVTKERPHLIVRSGLSHVPERRGIFANLTVGENLVIGAYSRRLQESDLEEVFALFPILKERRKQMAGTLSGGEQQMLAISRALLSKPKMILLDEPSLGLAPQITRSIFQTIEKINAQGTTILLVEQNAHMALGVANRAYVLETGQIRLEGPAKDLAKDDSIRKAYLGVHD